MSIRGKNDARKIGLARLFYIRKWGKNTIVCKCSITGDLQEMAMTDNIYCVNFGEEKYCKGKWATHRASTVAPPVFGC